MMDITNSKAMASTWYSSSQALFIAVAFGFLDTVMNIFGLAWNGESFTFTNIQRWFDLSNYHFKQNPVDFLAVAVIRLCILVGGGVGVFLNPNGGPVACAAISNVVFAVILIIVAFSPTKLLAFYEDENLRLAIGDWILMIWCVIASLFTQGIWVTVFTKVRSYNVSLDSMPILDEESEDDEQREKKLSSKQRETIRMLIRLFGYMAKEWPYYTACFIFLFMYSLSRVFIPYYTGEVVVSVFGEDASYAKLHKSVLIMTVLSISGALFGGLRGGSFTYSQARIDRRIRDHLFRSLVKQEIGFFDQNKTGEICSRLNADCQTMSNTLSLYINVLTRNVTMLFGSVIFMFSLSWRLSMVTVIAIPIIFLISKVYGVYYDKLSEETQESIAKANDVAEEVISAIRTVKSFACEKFESLRFLHYLDITLSIGCKKAIAYVGFVWTSELMQMGILIAVLWYGGHLLIKGKIDSGLLVSFLLYQFQLGENLRELGEVWNGLMQAVGASRKVFEFIDRRPEVLNRGKVAFDSSKNLEGKIEFKNVCFSYPTKTECPVMQNMSFTVNPGEVVALVGPSGSGKSSCIAMLEHFYEPESGQVLLDGIPVNEYDHKFLHTQVALVGQEPVLYSRSVKENIGYGIKQISDDEVEHAAKLSNAHDFIIDTTDGYETNVGEKGSQMSGGQKQRIAIARALVRKPVVLLLDEATSALDAESEHLVQEAISKNLSGHTVLVIAHRLSTVENADKIIVINHGKVEQEGVYSELAQTDGLFKTLVQKQLKSIVFYERGANAEYDISPEQTDDDGKRMSNGVQPVPIRRRRRNFSFSQSFNQNFSGTSFPGTGSYI
uniref:ABC-type antigen peptide transporter n=1 Tax=Syphacia muris TaxID=451379 RepID=A0A0N5AY89_9BILA